MNKHGQSSEDPRPTKLRPEEMPAGKPSVLEPRVREQALPEKHDDRFFDFWALAKARELGRRAVKQATLDRLGRGVRAFATWRSLRHEGDAQREITPDEQIVATTKSTIEKAEAEAKQFDARVKVEEREASRCKRDGGKAASERSSLPPALRGSVWDVVLALFAKGVVFGVDIFVLHLSLGLTTGTDRDHWFTALLMGAGVVVVGDVIGWIAAAGTIRKGGTFVRPGRSTIFAVAGLLVLATWFFGELGVFREQTLVALAHRDGVRIASPGFYTLAQILFLVGAAAVCFSYVARRGGRELLAQARRAGREGDVHRAAASAFLAKAEEARRIAAEAPILHAAATARIRSRKKVAAADAALDLQQGEYLNELIGSEYAQERADVESGVRYWQVEEESEVVGKEKSGTAAMVRAAIAAILASGVAFLLVGSLLAAVLTGVIVGAAFALAGGGQATAEEESQPAEHGHARLFVAELSSSTTGGDGKRVTDIERLKPYPNGHDKSLTSDDLKAVVDDA